MQLDERRAQQRGGFGAVTLCAALGYAVVDMTGSALHVFDGFHGTGSTIPPELDWFFAFLPIFFYGVCFAFPRIVRVLLQKGAVLCALGALGGLSLFLASPFVGVVGQPGEVVARGIILALCCFLFLGWMAVFSRMSLKDVALSVSLSYIANAIFTALCLLGPPGVLYVTSCALPLIGAIAYCLFCRAWKAELDCSGRSRAGGGLLMGAGNLIIALMLVEFAAALIVGLGDSSDGDLNLMGSAFAAILLVAAISAAQSVASVLQKGLVIAVFAIALGAFCLFLPLVPSLAAAEPLAYAGFALFNITSLSAFCALTDGGAARAVRFFSLVQLSGTTAFVGAQVVCQIGAEFMSEALFATGAVACAVAALAALMVGQSFGTVWGVGGVVPDASQVAVPLDGNEPFLDARCAALGQRFGLTLREQDVLKELAQRKTTGQIACTLFVSESTVKTHISHIYKKCGVKKRAQLIGLLTAPAKREEAAPECEEAPGHR